MKKALIAGAASFALAAMPVMGVFAESVTTDGKADAGETLTDNFSFSIGHECTLSRVLTGTAGEIGDGGHPTGAWTTVNTNSDAIAITGVAGNAYSLGSSKFNVYCNGTSGYSVAAVITDLRTSADTIATGSSAITTGTFSGNISSWTVSKTVDDTTTFYTSTDNGKDENIVASSARPTANAGQEFTMTYAVALADGQPAGAYAGSVQYTLTDLTPGA